DYFCAIWHSSAHAFF
nr:immunoglobulin light chain junction region [Macaca mulatta]MOX78135.1 immunoglobulin light chain junction region [Macaca mulatta]MOX79419.1 immunoglobulin light chain junction region [Macaca mulatta]MOX79644.1 immunoglobulin light chain junction region [Macaca mulatta]MOX80478.1 immunoglobulin light chain junction region [Macaca mulatta]